MVTHVRRYVRGDKKLTKRMECSDVCAASFDAQVTQRVNLFTTSTSFIILHSPVSKFTATVERDSRFIGIGPNTWLTS